MAEKAYVTPKVLRWARESARMTEVVAAAKVPISVEKLSEWELGISQPTINQAQSLAKAYKRPFALFFLPEIPRDFQPLQDFRKKNAKALSTSSIFIIREIQEKQSWISEAYSESGQDILPFVGRFSIGANPEVVGKDILDTLGINPANYSSDNPMREWIDAAESKGIFISRTSFIHSRLKLDSEEMQGFAISDSYAPFVFINTEDWKAPQLFTLVHELAHIWISESGISSEIDPDISSKEDSNPMEIFCNEVAANALMPESFIRNMSTFSFQSGQSVFKAAKNLGVSSFALLLRATKLNVIDFSTYQRLKENAEKEYVEFLRKEDEKKMLNNQSVKKGGPNYFLLQLNRNSRLFTQTVLDAYRGGSIEPTMASKLLNVQTNKFQKLEAQLYR